MIELQFSQLTDIGCVRKANEDNMGHAEVPNGKLYIVCDGMGGHVGGATASSIAVQSITEYFSRDKYENPFNALLKAIEFANTQIYNHAQSNPELKGMGTTVVVLLKQEDEFYIGHVGDSRIYLRSSGKLHRITKDHSFVQGLVEQGIIADSEAESHPRKNELTKALGIRPNVEPTICSKPIKPASKDTFLLCSDGLCGLVNDPTLNSIMSQADTTESAAHHLIEAARNAGGHDNITAQLIHIIVSPFEKSEFEDYTPQENLSTGNFGNSHTQTMDMEESPKTNDRKKLYTYGLIGFLLISLLVYLFWPSENNINSINNNSVTESEIPDNTFLIIEVEDDISKIININENDTTIIEGNKNWKDLIKEIIDNNIINFSLCRNYCKYKTGNNSKITSMNCEIEPKPGMIIYAVDKEYHIENQKREKCCPITLPAPLKGEKPNATVEVQNEDWEKRKIELESAIDIAEKKHKEAKTKYDDKKAEIEKNEDLEKRGKALEDLESGPEKKTMNEANVELQNKIAELEKHIKKKP